MKHLANCDATEFLRQANRCRKAAAEWLEKTDVSNIRKTRPEIPEDATDDERRELIEKQVRENLDRILDAAMEEYPEETLRLIALLCFTAPEDINDHSVGEYITAFDEIRRDQVVWDFFTSLIR